MRDATVRSLEVWVPLRDWGGGLVLRCTTSNNREKRKRKEKKKKKRKEKKKKKKRSPPLVNRGGPSVSSYQLSSGGRRTKSTYHIPAPPSVARESRRPRLWPHTWVSPHAHTLSHTRGGVQDAGEEEQKEQHKKDKKNYKNTRQKNCGLD